MVNITFDVVFYNKEIQVNNLHFTLYTLIFLLIPLSNPIYLVSLSPVQSSRLIIWEKKKKTYIIIHTSNSTIQIFIKIITFPCYSGEYKVISKKILPINKIIQYKFNEKMKCSTMIKEEGKEKVQHKNLILTRS